jgi:hypothetical protein
MITGVFCHPEPCPELVSWVVSASQVRRCSKSGQQDIPEPITAEIAAINAIAFIGVVVRWG